MKNNEMEKQPVYLTKNEQNFLALLIAALPSQYLVEQGDEEVFAKCMQRFENQLLALYDSFKSVSRDHLYEVFHRTGQNKDGV